MTEAQIKELLGTMLISVRTAEIAMQAIQTENEALKAENEALKSAPKPKAKRK